MYLGRNPAVGTQKMLDSLESQFNGVLTTFDLRYGGVPTYPTLSASLIVSLGGVLQEPGVAYYVSSDSIVFSEAPLAGAQCWILLYSEYGASQTSTHSALSLLNADDHLQYIHTTNTRTGVTAEFNTTGKITTTGNVGAGTTNPSEKLDVVGNIKLTGELRGPASFVIDPAAVGDNTGTVVIKGDLQVDGTTTTINSTTLTVDDKNITIADGASTLANIDTAGIDFGSTAVRVRYNYNAGTNSGLSIEGANVGIGITVPLTKLHVVSADPEVLLVERSGNANALIQYKNTDGVMYAGLTSSATGWGVDDDNNVGNGPMFFVSRATGNVGIATNSPVTPLHVSDGTSGVISTALYTSDYVTISAQATAPGFNIISANNSLVGGRGVFKATRSRGTLDTPLVPLANDDVFSLIGAVFDTSAAALATAAINLNVDGTVSAGVAPQRISFWTGTTNTRLERMRIDSSGNVSIGTTSGSGFVSVNNNTAGTINNVAYFCNAWGTPATGQGVRILLGGFLNNTTRCAAIEAAISDGLNGHHLAFLTQTAGAAPSERARIDSLGRFILGGQGSSAGNNHTLQVRNDGGGAVELFTAAASATGPFLSLSKSRGTAIAPTVVSVNDQIGTIEFRGWSGAAGFYRNGATIAAYVDAEPDTASDTTDMPGRLVFATTPDGGGTQVEAMTIKSSGNVGIGTDNPGYKLQVVGSFAATTKSFVIPHPTKEGYRLRYGSLEGPENGIYVRGRSTDSVIELPEYWVKLVDEDSITMSLTPIGRSQSLWVKEIKDNKVYVESDSPDINYFYTVFAERIDVDKLEVEMEVD